MTALSDVIASCHCAIYTYGVAAGFIAQPNIALDCQADYRILRDALIEKATALKLPVPAAEAAYKLPIEISNSQTAVTVCAQLENSLSAQFADFLSSESAIEYSDFTSTPQRCALRGYKWSGVSYAFPA